VRDRNVVLLKNLQDPEVGETPCKSAAERETYPRPVLPGTRGVLFAAGWDVVLHSLRMKAQPAAANGRGVLK